MPTDAELRGILSPLTELAAERRIAIVGITHFSKAVTNRAANKVIGSVAYSNAARATQCVVLDPEDEDRRLMLPAKVNLTQNRTGIAYTIIDGAIVFEPEPVDLRLNDILAAEGEKAKLPKIEKAVAWLKETLAGGPMPSDEVKAKAKAAGFGRIIWEAKDKAGVKPRKLGMKGPWMWELAPNNLTPGDSSATPGMEDEWRAYPDDL